MTPALLLLLVAEPSPLAVDQHGMLGIGLLRSSGDLPSFASSPDFERNSVWIHARAGIADSSPSTILGTQLGFEMDVRVGITPDESKELNATFPMGFAARAGLSLRALTFNIPLQGMVVPHLNGEFGAGGAHWWSDTARLSFMGGVRLAVAAPGEVNLEIDYTIVPFVITGSPGSMDVRPFEHRMTVELGAGPIGLGVWVTITRHQWRRHETAPYQSVDGRAIGASLEWRPR